MMSTRSRVVCTLVLLAYPFFAMGVSTSFGIIGMFLYLIASHCSLVYDPSSGLLLAAWRSPDTIVKVGGCALLFFPLMILFAFLWTQTSLLRTKTLSGHSVECPRALKPVTMTRSSEEIQYLLSQGRPSRSRYVPLDYLSLDTCTLMIWFIAL